MAIGEIGYDDQTALEDRYYRAQLQLAKEYDMVVMVHTPHRDKKRGTTRSMLVALEMGLDPSEVVIDHNNEETVAEVLDRGFWAAFTLYPQTKMGNERMVEIARRYDGEGADELTFLDITATSDGRDLILHIIEAVASQVFIPLTVGGGVRTVEDVRRLFNAGADKTSFNSAAIASPQVIREASDKYGAQCIVVAIDAKRRSAQDEQRIGTHGLPMGPGWDVYSHGGRKNVGLDAVAWATQMAAYGAGEILLTSMDRDGTKSGFDLALTRAVSDAVPVPVIASGGVGTLDHLADGIQTGGADAVLAASIFHFAEYTIEQAKRHLQARGIEVRL